MTNGLYVLPTTQVNNLNRYWYSGKSIPALSDRFGD